MIDLNKVAAIKLTQKLEPISPSEPIKPPTFAPSKNDPKPQYITYMSKNGRRDAILDTVPSQANRIEPEFVGTGLIPDVTFNVEGKTVSITKLGHRGCDAAARFSTGAAEIQT